MAEKRVVVWLDGRRYALPYNDGDPSGSQMRDRIATALQKPDARPTEIPVVPPAGVSGVATVQLWVRPNMVGAFAVVIEDYDEHDTSPNEW